MPEDAREIQDIVTDFKKFILWKILGGNNILCQSPKNSKGQ